jgi:hypothetical protein
VPVCIMFIWVLSVGNKEIKISDYRINSRSRSRSSTTNLESRMRMLLMHLDLEIGMFFRFSTAACLGSVSGFHVAICCLELSIAMGFKWPHVRC